MLIREKFTCISLSLFRCLGKIAKEKKIIAGENNNALCGKGSIHAEVDGLRNFFTQKNRRKITYVDIVSVRITSTGRYLNAKPCVHCSNYMSNSKVLKKQKIVIRRVYYTNAEGNLSYSTLCNLTSKHITKSNR